MTIVKVRTRAISDTSSPFSRGKKATHYLIVESGGGEVMRQSAEGEERTERILGPLKCFIPDAFHNFADV